MIEFLQIEKKTSRELSRMYKNTTRLKVIQEQYRKVLKFISTKDILVRKFRLLAESIAHIKAKRKTIF